MVKEFTARLPMDVISSLLGIPEADRRCVQEGSNAMLHREPGSPLPTPEAIAAQQQVITYFGEQIAERRARPRDDMMTVLTQVEMAGRRWHRRAALGRRHPPVPRAARHRGQRDRDEAARHRLLRALAQSRTSARWSWPIRALARNAVEELLRFDPPSQYQGRVTTRDVELHGQIVPKHSRVLLINGASGRDERKFPDPDRFDVRREIDVHLGLGYGRHLCLGASLARLESRIAIEELLAPLPRLRRARGRDRAHALEQRARAVGARARAERRLSASPPECEQQRDACRERPDSAGLGQRVEAMRNLVSVGQAVVVAVGIVRVGSQVLVPVDQVLVRPDDLGVPVAVEVRDVDRDELAMRGAERGRDHLLGSEIRTGLAQPILVPRELVPPGVRENVRVTIAVEIAGREEPATARRDD